MQIKQLVYKLPISVNKPQTISTLASGILEKSDNQGDYNPGVVFAIREDEFLSDVRISKIGIQAPVGTTFFLNNRPIVIGFSGVYELDNEHIEINSVKLEKLPDLGYIIIDYIEEV